MPNLDTMTEREVIGMAAICYYKIIDIAFIHGRLYCTSSLYSYCNQDLAFHYPYEGNYAGLLGLSVINALFTQMVGASMGIWDRYI